MTGDLSTEGLFGKEKERDRGLCVEVVANDLLMDDLI
jgi:hypothetical protein